MTLILKRDLTVQEYNGKKVEIALKKAFKACHQEVTEQEIFLIMKELSIQSLNSVEDIQNQIEDSLMKLGYYNVAKAYILYRESHRNEREIGDIKKYIKSYIGSSNAATGSKFDSNANVTDKNVATLNGELFKGMQIALNRSRMTDMNTKLWGTEVAKEYIRMLESHELYKHDETSAIYPYCVAITMYPMLTEGLKKLGGISDPPKHLRSFCGIFVNMVFTIAAQFAGAIATPEFLLYFDYFCRKEWGEEYWKHMNTPVESHSLTFHETEPRFIEIKSREIEQVIEDYFQNIVYYLNQPAAARNFQSVFWNISYFDKNYFEGIFGDFVFPDGTKPSWDSLNCLQKKFMKWFNAERTKKLLTFPVETMALLTDEQDVLDKEYADFTAEMYAEGHSFFTYMSDSADSLSSCCRLRNEVTDNQFSYSLGAGGIATGSKSVMTLNINRLVQDAVKNGRNTLEVLREKVQLVHKFQTSYNELLKEFKDSHMLTVYDAGFIDMKKQYLTIGVNGVVEAAEFLGIKVSDNPVYKEFIQSILSVLSTENKKAKTNELMFNTEFVPRSSGHIKSSLIDLELLYRTTGGKQGNCAA